MKKLFKVSTAVMIALFALNCMASAKFEHIKEELWFKGESALYQKADYSALGEMGEATELKEAWDSWQGQVHLPEELEVSLVMWISKK